MYSLLALEPLYFFLIIMHSTFQPGTHDRLCPSSILLVMVTQIVLMSYHVYDT